MSLNADELAKYAKQVDYHIRSLVDLTEVMREIKVALKEAANTKEDIYQMGQDRLVSEMGSLTHQLEKLGLPKIDTYEMRFRSICKKLEEGWPVAVDPDFLNIDPQVRAESIVDMIIMDHLEGVNFLDFACDTGHIVNEVKDRHAKKSVGFSYQQEWEFSNSDNMIFTCNFDEVKSHAPYDVVLMYDILDHVDNPEEVLESVASVLSPKGRIYVRCHPWCSKHGGHLHSQINNAYLHLILDDTELTRLGGYECKKTTKIYNPIQTYRSWFERVGLEIQQELPIEDEPDSFFLQEPMLLDRLQRHWKDDHIKPYIAIDFVDYVLEPKEVQQRVF